MKSRQAAVARRALDNRLSQLEPAERFRPPALGWVRAIREALGMSRADLAARMGISAASVSDIERSEGDRRTKLDTLARAADAMDCDLVYAFIPRRGLNGTVERAARAKLAPHLAAVARTMELEAQASPVDRDSIDEEVRHLIESGQVWR
jgi:predicted DNA-binding mobile mystery protein A